MTAFSTALLRQSGIALVVHWIGQSGRAYGLVGENLDRFAMTKSDVYLIARGDTALWVGSADDLIADPVSRARFRLALKGADCVLRLLSSAAESERLSIIWDLERAEPIRARSAA